MPKQHARRDHIFNAAPPMVITFAEGQIVKLRVHSDLSCVVAIAYLYFFLLQTTDEVVEDVEVAADAVFDAAEMTVNNVVETAEAAAGNADIMTETAAGDVAVASKTVTHHAVIEMEVATDSVAGSTETNMSEVVKTPEVVSDATLPEASVGGE